MIYFHARLNGSTSGRDRQARSGSTEGLSILRARPLKRLTIAASLAIVAPFHAASTLAAGDAGASPQPEAAAKVIPAGKERHKSTPKTVSFSFEDASGKQSLSVTFLPKRRVALTIKRDRSDGCHWSKDLTARFEGVEGYGLPDGDTTDVNEYEIEPKQMPCRMFLDIEKETMAFADIDTDRCAAECKLTTTVVRMTPKGN
jgi:hypothetical protein